MLQEQAKRRKSNGLSTQFMLEVKLEEHTGFESAMLKDILY